MQRPMHRPHHSNPKSFFLLVPGPPTLYAYSRVRSLESTVVSLAMQDRSDSHECGEPSPANRSGKSAMATNALARRAVVRIDLRPRNKKRDRLDSIHNQVVPKLPLFCPA